MLSCRRCVSLQVNILKFKVFPKPSRCPPYRNATLFKTDSLRNIACSSSNRQATIINSNQDENETEIIASSKLEVEEYHLLTADNLEGGFYDSFFPTDIKEEECDIVTQDPVNQATGIVEQVTNKKKTAKKKSVQLAVEEEKKNLLEEIRYQKNLELQNISLQNYLAMCMQQKLMSRALLTLKSYQQELNLANNGSKVYEVMLNEAASMCNWNLIKEVIMIMNQAKVPLTIQCFNACFICLGAKSARNESHLEPLAENLLDKMSSCGIEVDDLFKNGQFHSDHRELALRGVQLGLPDFQPKKIPPLVTYSNSILNALNDFKIDPVTRSPADGLGFDPKRLSDLAAEQFKTEMSGVMEMKSISNLQATDNRVIDEIKQLENSWEKALRDGIIRELGICREQYETAHHKKMHIYPYVSFLSENDYVQILMQEVQMLSGISNIYSPTIIYMSRLLGLRIMEAARIKHIQQTGVLDKFKIIYREYCQWYLEPSLLSEVRNPRQVWQQLVHEAQGQGPDMNDVEFNWPFKIVQSIGDFFYSVILNNAKIENPKKPTEKIPAYYVVYRTKNLKWHKEIKPHPHLIDLYENLRHVKLHFNAALLPMLSPPLPWHSYSQGGYLVSKVGFVRLPYAASEGKRRIQITPSQQLYPAMDALNALGTIPWKINSPILDLIIHVFNQKGSQELDVAQPPSVLPLPLQMSSEMPLQEKKQVFKERATYKQRKAEMYSLWCDTLYRLSLANHYRGKVFWLPHNMDFRGRVYPCPPNLTHLSNDMARSLLQFALGKKLGRDGFDWLKIHTINLTGLKKRDSVRERLRFADEMMPEILDSAQNPLTGRKWWTKSDEPWQTLAACMELDAALKCPDPTEYVSHLPIHQDGSCNGLQHYAALGRDQTGAESVNLFPADKPQDVYSNVAVLVENERQKDAASGIEVAQILEGHINRKVIKQTVMTTVYGVTRYGARLQIMKQLKEIPELSPEQASCGAAYLTVKTFQSLQQMFTSAKEIQDWLTDSAKLISSVVGDSVEWVTPTGLPVVQPYRKDPYDSTSKPNTMKQRNAFPPNFIHSLDSSHMMLTSLFCQRKSITFASIHDCFWTHACTVDQMNKICREQFVSLHSQPILEDLSKYLVSHFAYAPSEISGSDSSQEVMLKKRLNQILHEVPKRGTFDLRRVLDSVYFFS